MRDRKEIMDDADEISQVAAGGMDDLILEVLLDIRNILAAAKEHGD